MEIAAVISFLALVLSWMAMPASSQVAETVQPTLQAAPAKA